MKTPNQHNEIFRTPSGPLLEVPGFPGYYVGEEGEVYSTFGYDKKVLKPFYTRRGEKRIGKPRVCLTNSDGKYIKLRVEEVWGLSGFNPPCEVVADLGELF